MDPEQERLDALHALHILDTPPEREFEEMTRLAALVLNISSAAVSLVDDKRQWLKARVGIALPETAREDSFCTYVVASGEFLEVADARTDPRFADNPFVLIDDGIRFYAGAPLLTAAGHCLGTLCVYDSDLRPRLTAGERRTLVDLARMTVERIETRKILLDSEIAARVIETTSDAVLAVGQEGLITFWNGAAERMFGHPAALAIGAALDLILPGGPSAAAHKSGFARSVQGGSARLIGKTVELTARRATGEEFPIELSLARWAGTPQDKGGGFAAIIRDIGPRKALEHDRDDARLFLDNIIDHLPATLFVKDSETRQYLLLNKAGEALIGRAAADIIGRTDRELFEDGASYHDLDTSVLASSGVETNENVFARPDGSSVTLLTKRIVVDQPDSGRKYILGLTENITDLRHSQDDVRRLAHHDSLTGLINRATYIDRLGTLVADGRPFALIAVDLDRFKAVNDQFGHRTGDQLLMEAGNRLRSAIGPNDLVARIGADEFVVVVLVEGEAGPHATLVANAIAATLTEPYRIGPVTARTGVSLGIAVAPDDGDAVEELRQAADFALQSAKAGARGGIRFFNADMNRAATDRRLLERDLRRAIEGGDIYVEYQPVIAAATGQVSSFEALARWQHPIRGAIGPDIFIAMAEECGLVGTLGAHVLQIACTAAARWPAHLRIAVNLSPLQFEDPDLLPTIGDALAKSGLAADRLQLEVTESLVVRDVDTSFRILAELRALGVQILMDDFGVGYSSLSYFERFPFDKVKIDRSFVHKMGTVPAARAIIAAVVGIGRSLGMGIVAEGVETEAQRDALVAIGCTHLQGYLFSRPMAIDAFADIVAPLLEDGLP